MLERARSAVRPQNWAEKAKRPGAALRAEACALPQGDSWVGG